MKNIALVGATGLDWWQDEKKTHFVQANTPEGYKIANLTPRFGTHSVESFFDEAYNSPFILEQVARANREGFDVIIIDCACDPVLDAAREISNIPVIGPMNASLHLALTLGRKFSIVTVQGRSLLKCLEDVVIRSRLSAFCASIRCIEMPVLEIRKKPQEAQTELLNLCFCCVNEDGADVIVLGCTGLSHEVDTKIIKEKTKAPVLDPFIVSIRTAQLLVEIGLCHSKVAYPVPPRKDITEDPSLTGVFDEILKA